MSERPIVAFSDGSSKGNPGPGGWGVVIVTPDGSWRNWEVAPHTPRTTRWSSQRPSRRWPRSKACLDQSRSIRTQPTSSRASTNGSGAGARRGWRTAEGNEVLNRDLWEQLAGLVDARGKGAIAWHYVRGHVGTPGNERVDGIADTLARLGEIDLYRGPLTDYGRAILDVPADTTVPKRSGHTASRGKSAVPPYAYLSLVDGELMRHSTWADCERRVKGRSGRASRRPRTRPRRCSSFGNGRLNRSGERRRAACRGSRRVSAQQLIARNRRRIRAALVLVMRRKGVPNGHVTKTSAAHLTYWFNGIAMSTTASSNRPSEKAWPVVRLTA